MNKISLIPYHAEELRSFLENYKKERGFLGLFPSILAAGRLFGVIEGDLNASTNPEHGYTPYPVNKRALLSEILRLVPETSLTGKILIQDSWALIEDYNSPRLNGINKIALDDGVYICVENEKFEEIDADDIEESIKKIVSSFAVVIFLEEISEFKNIDSLISGTVAVAIEAFDGQGWIFWIREHEYMNTLNRAGDVFRRQ